MVDNNAIVILRALLDGQTVTLAGRDYLFAEDYRLCVPAHNQNGELRLLVVDMGDGISLKDFIGLCSKASETEMFAIGANVVLNDLKRG